MQTRKEIDHYKVDLVPLYPGPTPQNVCKEIKNIMHDESSHYLMIKNGD